MDRDESFIRDEEVEVAAQKIHLVHMAELRHDVFVECIFATAVEAAVAANPAYTALFYPLM